MANDLSEDTIQEMSLMQILERKAHTTVETGEWIKADANIGNKIIARGIQEHI